MKLQVGDQLEEKQLNPPIRTFGYNIAVARVRSHFGGVEVGTEFAASDHRYF